MRKGIFFLFLLCQVFFINESLAQNECKPCGQRVFKLFDITNRIPEPKENPLKSKWRDLFLIGSGYTNWYFGTNATQIEAGCIAPLVPRVARKDVHPADAPEGFDKWAAGHASEGSPAVGADYIVYADLAADSSVTLSVVTGRKHLGLYRAQSQIFADDNNFYEKGTFLPTNQTKGSINQTNGFPFYDELLKWEKKQRDEKLCDCALNPKLEVKFDKTDIPVGESTTVHFRLIDCDDTPLANRKIEIDFSEESGTLSGTGYAVDTKGTHTVTTDKDGKAQLLLKAGKKKGDAGFKVGFKYKRPSEREMYLPVFETITIVGEPKLKGTIEVKTLSHFVRTNSEGKVYEKGESERRYKTNLSLRIFDNLITHYIDKKNSIEDCTGSGNYCDLASGSSIDHDKPFFEAENYPVEVSVSEKHWQLCDDELILISKDAAAGTVHDFRIQTAIKLIKRNKKEKKDDDFKPAPLIKSTDPPEGFEPAPLVNPDYYIRLMVHNTGMARSSTPKYKREMYNCYSKSWIPLEPLPFSVHGSSLGSLPSTDPAGKVYTTEPVFNEKEVIEFLKSKKGSKTFRFKTNHHTKYDETETEDLTFVTLTLEYVSN